MIYPQKNPNLLIKKPHLLRNWFKLCSWLINWLIDWMVLNWCFSAPSLTTLCKLCILENKLDVSSLPKSIRYGLPFSRKFTIHVSLLSPGHVGYDLMIWRNANSHTCVEHTVTCMHKWNQFHTSTQHAY